MQVRVNRGGRPPTVLHEWSHRFGKIHGTPADALDFMAMTGQTVMVACRRENRRRMRATIVTAARRRGMKLTTEWTPADPTDDTPTASGLLVIREVSE